MDRQRAGEGHLCPLRARQAHAKAANDIMLAPTSHHSEPWRAFELSSQLRAPRAAQPAALGAATCLGPLAASGLRVAPSSSQLPHRSQFQEPRSVPKSFQKSNGLS